VTGLDEGWEKIYQRRESEPLNKLCEQYLRQELPPTVRQELERALDRDLEPLEEKLKSQLTEIVRGLQLQPFQSYTRHRN
jgi:hypothetical protein